MAYPALPVFELRRADEDRPAFSLRLVAFVVRHDFVPGTIDAESADLACSQSVGLYGRQTTPGTADAINRAVTMLRSFAERERARVKAALVALGFTDEPISRPAAESMPAASSASPAGSGGLTPAEVEFVRTMIREFSGQQGGHDDGTDGGSKVRANRKPKPSFPPAGCAAPF